MATTANPLQVITQNLRSLPARTAAGLLAGLAALIAVASVGWMWTTAPDYRVLFANVTDKDGGAIVTQLEQMKVPYRFSEGGGAIMVPADKVHDLRLKLASQGLPKGAVTGFDVMDGQKFGLTQFQEQINYQRALEGELARSIQTLAAVSAARVHLAIPRQTLFLRDQNKDRPRASVLVTLHPGRTLDRAQIAGIAHLVSSSIPDLAESNVSLVDQNGSLLTTPDAATPGQMSAQQLTYVHDIEQGAIKRIEDILEPLVGRGNARAQVTADVDFTLSESTAETYKPNQNVADAAVRSSRTSDNGTAAQTGAQGVPGAASNQPGAQPPAATTTGGNANARREATINYEVDKTVRVTRATPGAVKRLSAAVILNHKKVTAQGKVTATPYTADELTQINALVKEAMGYSQTRGDTLNVVNAAFTAPEPETITEVPLWKQPDNIALAKELGRYLLLGMIALFIMFKILKPVMRQLASPRALVAGGSLEIPVDGEAGPGTAALGAPGAAGARPAGELVVQNGILSVRQIAKQDPKMVANVVRTWVNGGE